MAGNGVLEPLLATEEGRGDRDEGGSGGQAEEVESCSKENSKGQTKEKKKEEQGATKVRTLRHRLIWSRAHT